jgi:hypothetical protein
VAAFAVRHQFLRKTRTLSYEHLRVVRHQLRENLGVFATEGADVRALAVEVNTGAHHLESPFDPASLLPGG